MKRRFNTTHFMTAAVAAVLGIGVLAGCNTLPPATPGTTTSTPVPSVKGTPTPTPAVTPTATPKPTPTPTVPPTPTPTGTPGEVCFSSADHYCNSDIKLELSIQSGKSGYITYTTDGTEPTKNSKRYDVPIVLKANDSNFPNCYSFRAKAFYDDGTVSDTYFHTYFLNTAIDSRYTTVVFSINGDPATLTELPDGILVGTNYKQRGEASERKVHIEAIAPGDTLLFSQNAGVRDFGGTSREHAIKSLKLYARKEYNNDAKGTGSFYMPLFQSVMTGTTDLITKYDKMVLRNTGDDFQLGFIRDELMQRLAKKAGRTCEGVIPAVAYVNGKYYGFYWLHESYCNKFFQNKNGESNGKYVVLEGSDWSKAYGSSDLEHIGSREYNSLYSKYSKANLTDDTTFAELQKLIDVNGYLDYMSYNMYVCNYDWPQGNYRVFRYYADEESGETYEESGDRDGRWHYLLHDMDSGMGTYQSTADAGAARDDLTQVLGNPSNTRYSPLLAALLKRTDCRDYFIRKMCEYMTSTLSEETICATLDEMLAERDTEMAFYMEHLRELAKTDSSIWAGYTTLNKHMDRIRSFAKQRPEYLRKYLESFFKINLDDYLKDFQ